MLHPQSGPESRGVEEDRGPDGRKESLKNARPGEDRPCAAEIAGKKAGEANARTKGLFVHPEEKIQMWREEPKWCAGVHCACIPTTDAGPGPGAHCLHSVFPEWGTGC